jgi:hypothetical protein
MSEGKAGTVTQLDGMRSGDAFLACRLAQVVFTTAHGGSGT